MTATDKLTTLTLSTSLTLLALLKAGPTRIQHILSTLLKINSQPDLRLVLGKLKWIAGVSAIIGANRLLNHLARNNWVLPSKTKWDWSMEVAVVTGGSGGIGSVIVKGLAEKGVRVAVVDVVAPGEGLFAAYAKNVHYFHCDITNKQNVDALSGEITQHFNQAPTILVNNAGIAHAHTILEATPEYLKKLFDINLFSHFYTLQSFLPSMIKTGKGHVVTICSMSSFVTPAGLVDYASSKAAVMALHEGLNAELKYRYKAPFIRTTVVHPTYVRTPLTGSWEKSLGETKALTLSPEFVGGEVVKAILSGSAGQIMLPRSLAVTSALRAFPWWFQEVARGTTRDDMRRL